MRGKAVSNETRQKFNEHQLEGIVKCPDCDVELHSDALLHHIEYSCPQRILECGECGA